jgi:hypothetical protein
MMTPLLESNAAHRRVHLPVAGFPVINPERAVSGRV